MPTTIEELEAAILFVNRNILEQYEDCQREVLFIVGIYCCNFCLVISDVIYIYRDFTDRRSCKKNSMQTRRNLESV